MTTETLITNRPYGGEADLQPITTFLNYCSDVDNLDDLISLEELRLEFEHPKVDTSRDLQLWNDAAGRVVGFGQLWLDETETSLDCYFYWRIHPEVRNTNIAEQMMNWASETLQAEGRKRNLPVNLRASAKETFAYGNEVLKGNGFKIVRYSFKMQRPSSLPIPEPQFPAGYTLRHVASEADAAAWVDCYNLSFIDHYNFHPRTLEDHKHWYQSPEYNPERDLILVDENGQVVAFCFCNVSAMENERSGRSEGWIGLLGTRRGYRKLGLGSAMLYAGLRRLKDEGVETALLGVDAENPSGALQLYERNGFTKRDTSITYLKQL